MTLWPLLAVAFSLAQAGPPLDAYGPGSVARTSGSGSLTVARPLAFTGVQTQPARVRHVELAQSIGRSRLRLRVERAELTAFADGSRLLDLDVRVRASNDPACPIGSTGSLYLLDDAQGSDELSVLLCPPRFEHYYNPLRGRIAISIR